MSKFKVGDTVRRTSHSRCEALVGECYIVSDVNGTSLDLEGHERTEVSLYNYSVVYFELVQAASEQPAVLTPREVFECILEGVPLEYRIKSVTAKQWYDVNNPKNVDLEDIECAEYRKKPTTVLINGISVPAPASKKPDGDYIYCVNLADERVIALDARYAKSKHYWSTKEEAQEVLDAIMTSFSK